MSTAREFTPSGYDQRAVAIATPEERDLDRDLLARATADQFQIVRLLGRGATGAVYLARDLKLHRVVAIKVLRWDLMSSEPDTTRFRREARTSGQLVHPRIVPLYAFGETDDVMYMILQYVPGESLGARLRREGMMAATEVRRLLADLALTLEYAHREGIVHRDLKPENILLEQRPGAPPQPMIMDFGVATKTWWEPAPGERQRSFGTRRFMSPEQAAGDSDIDGRSDLYSLGILGWLMLTGRFPDEGSTNATTSPAGGRTSTPDPPPRIPALAPDADAALVAAIERCLCADPDDRFRHARDLHTTLMAPANGAGRLRHAVTTWLRRVGHAAGERSLSVRQPRRS
ncbi:MAG TPA: serine/threonine-protein kinase [Gemmatimonadaceae bacterium]|nr:serine/threonine-protein kinase [Gemmatimonadaceae bacterium]